MKSHVQNPWTRSPSLMINISVEQAQQLAAVLMQVDIGGLADDNQRWALSSLRGVLAYALNTPLPHGLKGVDP